MKVREASEVCMKTKNKDQHTDKNDGTVKRWI